MCWIQLLVNQIVKFYETLATQHNSLKLSHITAYTYLFYSPIDLFRPLSLSFFSFTSCLTIHTCIDRACFQQTHKIIERIRNFWCGLSYDLQQHKVTTTYTRFLGSVVQEIWTWKFFHVDLGEIAINAAYEISRKILLDEMCFFFHYENSKGMKMLWRSIGNKIVDRNTKKKQFSIVHIRFSGKIFVTIVDWHFTLISSTKEWILIGSVSTASFFGSFAKREIDIFSRDRSIILGGSIVVPSICFLRQGVMNVARQNRSMDGNRWVCGFYGIKTSKRRAGATRRLPCVRPGASYVIGHWTPLMDGSNFFFYIFSHSFVPKSFILQLINGCTVGFENSWRYDTLRRTIIEVRLSSGVWSRGN